MREQEQQQQTSDIEIFCINTDTLDNEILDDK